MCNINYKKHTVNLILLILGSLFIFYSNLASGSADTDHSHHHHMMNNANGYTIKSEEYVIPDVTLTQSNGHSTSLKELINSNEPIMLNFIFTSCTAICPIMSGTFAQVNTRLKSENSDVRMISISIDPEYDTPSKLEKYATKFNANSNWTFLTGNLKDIISVQKAFKAYRGKKMNHAPATFIRTSNTKSWLRLDGFASSGEIMAEYKKINNDKL